MAINRRLIVVFGALGLVTTMTDTVRLFLRAADHSWLAVLTWSLFAVWLFGPLGWTVRQFRRARRLEPTVSVDVPDEPDELDELSAAAVSQLIFGYGTAAFALRVVAVCLAR